MTSPHQEYRNLLSLTQSFILAEFKSRQKVFSDPSTYEFFKQYQPKAKQQQNHVNAAPRQAPTTARPQPSPTPQQPKRVEPPPAQQQTHQAPPPPAPKQPQPPPLPQQPTESRQPEPTIPEEKPVVSRNRHFSLKLEPVTEVKEIELASIKKEIEKLFPEKQLMAHPPADDVARKVGQKWKQEAKAPEVVILSFQEHPDRQVFLQNMKAAINQRLAPCAIYSAHTIESKNAWDKLFAMKDLKLIVTTDYGMYSLPGLMRHYRESPEKSQRYLGGIPLLLLTDISLYLKQPQLKSALWQALCTMLPSVDKS